MNIKTDIEKDELLYKIKISLRLTDSSYDTLLETLLSNAYSYAHLYTGREEIPSNILIEAVAEDFSKHLGQGLSKRSFSGSSEEYRDGYSRKITAMLSKLRKLKSV